MARAGAGPAGGGATKHRYTKEAKVGEGTYAIVYLGRQAGTNRRVAIKSIRIGAFKDGLPPPTKTSTSKLNPLRNGYVRCPRNKIHAGTSS